MDQPDTKPTLPPGEYCIAEMLGHRRLVGRFAEVERFGAKMLQIEPIFNGRLLAPLLHSGASLYSFTQVDAETAMRNGHESLWELPKHLQDAVQGDPLKIVDLTSYRGVSEQYNEVHGEFVDDLPYHPPAPAPRGLGSIEPPPNAEMATFAPNAVRPATFAHTFDAASHSLVSEADVHVGSVLYADAGWSCMDPGERKQVFTNMKTLTLLVECRDGDHDLSFPNGSQFGFSLTPPKKES
jgi:hypothetical protein